MHPKLPSIRIAPVHLQHDPADGTLVYTPEFDNSHPKVAFRSQLTFFKFRLSFPIHTSSFSSQLLNPFKELTRSHYLLGNLVIGASSTSTVARLIYRPWKGKLYLTCNSFPSPAFASTSSWIVRWTQTTYQLQKISSSVRCLRHSFKFL